MYNGIYSRTCFVLCNWLFSFSKLHLTSKYVCMIDTSNRLVWPKLSQILKYDRNFPSRLFAWFFLPFCLETVKLLLVLFAVKWATLLQYLLSWFASWYFLFFQNTFPVFLFKILILTNFTLCSNSCLFRLLVHTEKSDWRGLNTACWSVFQIIVLLILIYLK